MKKLSRVLVPLLSIAAIVGLDQWSKYLIIQHFAEGEEKNLIGEAIVLTYVQNRGMAWGFFQNGQLIFSILTPLAICAVIFLYVRTPWEKEYRPIRIAEVMMVGGAIGNLLDRIFRYEPSTGSMFHGYVVDMIYAKFIHFPVFNVADIFVTLAFFFMIFLLLFVYNEDEFNKCFGNFPQKEPPKHLNEMGLEDKDLVEKEEAAETEAVAETAEVAEAQVSEEPETDEEPAAEPEKEEEPAEKENE
jgi:signal peptidase II